MWHNLWGAAESFPFPATRSFLETAGVGYHDNGADEKVGGEGDKGSRH